MHNNRESRPDRSVSADRRGCRTAPGTGRPVNRKSPAISPVRCSHYPLFHRQPRVAHIAHHRQVLSTMHGGAESRLGGQCRQRWARERDKPWQGSVHRGRPSAARGWAPSRHRAAPHPCGHV